MGSSGGRKVLSISFAPGVAEESGAAARGLCTCGKGESASGGFLQKESGRDGPRPAREGEDAGRRDAEPFRRGPKPSGVVGVMATRPNVNALNRDYGNFVEPANVGNAAGGLSLTDRFSKNPKTTV